MSIISSWEPQHNNIVSNKTSELMEGKVSCYTDIILNIPCSQQSGIKWFEGKMTFETQCPNKQSSMSTWMVQKSCLFFFHGLFKQKFPSVSQD